MATKKKTTKKATAKRKVIKKATLTWGKDVKAHPVSGKPCAGRPMSQRDQKLFTKMGKRRKGVTPTNVNDVYGVKKPAAKKKPVAKKKPAAKKTATRKPAAKKTATRKPAAKKAKAAPKRRKGSVVTVVGLPVRSEAYVIVDGRMHYQASSRLLTTARKKAAALESQNPRKKFRIVKLEKAKG